jgi:hypothetical protein
MGHPDSVSQAVAEFVSTERNPQTAVEHAIKKRRLKLQTRRSSIFPGEGRIELQQHGGNLSMFRSFIYVVGISAFLTAWALYREQSKRPMPVKKAAELLQEAWADNHTHA